MCGIYGKVMLDRQADREEGLRRTAMLHHRGPDYSGHYAAGNVFLGHARLSILDLTSAGNQPFGDEQAKLVFNGEIYNWKELHARYLDGCHLNSHSDTEVLYLLLRQLGPACLPLLNGMFSFAYYTPQTSTMLLARDMIGIKPLYFGERNRSFEFSSEIKTLDVEPNYDRLKEYLVFGRFGEDFLPYKGVSEVLPGSYVELNCVTGDWRQTSFRETEDLVRKQKYLHASSLSDPVDHLDRLLQHSVSIHEQSDAPIGFLCSGGLDSSLISAVAGKRNSDIALYHADFEGKGREYHFAKQVSEHIGVPLRTTTISQDVFWETFPEMTYAQDLPIQHPHSVSLAMLAGRIKSDGIKVMLSGEGADELFNGYYFHSSYAKMISPERSSDFRGKVGTVLRKAWRRLRSASDPYIFFDELNRSFQAHAHVGFGDAWSLSEPIQALSLVGQDFKAWARWQQALDAFEWMDDKSEALINSFQLFYFRYHLQPLLHRLDRMLMHHSIEGRVPFLENDMVEFAVNLPLRQKIQKGSGKQLLKKVALRYLPSDIVNREKLGFALPWGDYSSTIPEILRDGFVTEWTRLTNRQLASWINNDPVVLYRLISIEVWGRIFVHKTPWTEVTVRF